MNLRVYEYAGGTYQFYEGDAPEGAVLVEIKQRPAPANKAGKSPASKGGSKRGSDNRPPGDA